MSHGLPEIKIDRNEHIITSQSFSDWVKSQVVLRVSQIFGIATFISFSVALIYYIQHGKYSEYLEPFKIQKYVIWAHIPILLGFIYWLITIINKNDQGQEMVRTVYERTFGKTVKSLHLRKSRIQLKRFKNYFLLFWIGMLLLYISFAFQSFYTNEEKTGVTGIFKSIKEAEKTTSKTNLKDNINDAKTSIKELEDKGTIIVEQGIINDIKEIKSDQIDLLDKEGYSVEEKETINKIKSIYEDIKKLEKADVDALGKKLVFQIITFELNNLGSLIIFFCFILLYQPVYNRSEIEKSNNLIYFAIVTMSVVMISFPLIILIKLKGEVSQSELSGYIIGFDALSGVLNAIALALLIARLDSKFIGLPSVLISVLYGYSAIQPLFVAFEQPGEIFQIIKTIVLIVVFILKIYFFFIITYALQTGRMLNFLFCFPTLEKRNDSIFANNFLIEHQKTEKNYGFSIHKKDRLIYTSTIHIKTEDEYFKQIEKFRELAKKESAYEIKKKDRNYVIEIADSHKKIFCKSTGFKSKNKAEKIKFESIEMLPYCISKINDDFYKVKLLSNDRPKKPQQLSSKSINKEKILQESKKENLRKIFGKMKDVDMFSDIKDVKDWQKEIRDEWE